MSKYILKIYPESESEPLFLDGLTRAPTPTPEVQERLKLLL